MRRSFARILMLCLFLPFVSGTAYSRDMESLPVVKLQSLDKITARTMTFEANVGNTIKFGSLYIKIQACKKASPVDRPESAAFLQIWEPRPVKEDDKSAPKEDAQWIFSGWMFASSPALSHMDHPVYDVWVLDCLSEKSGNKKKMPPVDAEPGEGEIDAGQAPAQPAIKDGGQPAPAPEATPLDTSTDDEVESQEEALPAPGTPATDESHILTVPTPSPAPDAGQGIEEELSPLGD